MTKMPLMTDVLPVLAQGTGQGPSPVPQLLFFGLIFAAMWFLMIAPQRKKQKEHDKMVAALATGDEVVLASGIFGEITNVKPDRFVVRIADSTKVEVQKGFVQALVKKRGEEKK